MGALIGVPTEFGHPPRAAQLTKLLQWRPPMVMCGTIGRHNTVKVAATNGDVYNHLSPSLIIGSS